MKKYKYEVFTSKIEENIKNGILKAGDRLPSIRQIKQEYGLSTSSVQSGFDDLLFKGLATSFPRSGYCVAVGTKNVNDETLVTLNLTPRNAVFRDNISLTSYRKQHAETAFFNAATPSDLFVPQKLVLRTMQQIIREKSAALLRYYPSNGSDELRELIVRRSAQHGAAISMDELLITDGALQAFYIALAITTEPNDIVAIESPCVFSMLEVIASLRLRTIEIPVRGEGGLDTEYLKNACSKNNIKVIVVTPNFHNPTGILMSGETKHAVYEIAHFHHIPIIENDIYGDLYFSHSRPTTIRNLDNEGLVLTFSSFAKTIAPGIRLGWLAPGKFFEKAERLKFSLGRSVSPLNQELITKLLNTSSYDRHLRIFRQQLKKQALQLVEQINRCFPAESHTYTPAGGYSLWTRLPATIDMQLFYDNCAKSGAYFAPGAIFSFTDAYDHCFRTVFSQRIADIHLETIANIGDLLKKELY
ncbi:PLP-dependent aminotransferase family protein [Sphingobacterium detergens]|uniref:DNA-binding transcriptional MocR family regulator n=1 Tax=Sphingobacterium detergens TaxID=1145106 RepID=A0A420BII3_SPHD1|nr:PLP-dependent aminotransferase family protein [Sphingobacterium detergens]RKE56522.1 DNA-binding transcriptional MocR family regulator [Sphingobacterium detergens]